MQLHYAIDHQQEEEQEEEQEGLEPYPACEVDYIAVTKKQKVPEIVSVFDARHLYSSEEDEEEA
jgi:hypothetical protein